MAKGTSGGASQSAAQSGRNNAINTSAAKNSAASAQQRLKERSAAFKEAQITGAKQVNGAAALQRLNSSNNYEGWTPGAIYEQGKINETVDYLRPKQDSPQYDHAQTSRYLDEANNEIRRRKGTDTEQTWIQLANELDSKLRADYSLELSDYRSQLKTLQDEEATLSSNLKNSSRAVETGMYDASIMKAYDDGIRQKAQNKTRQGELSVAISQLESEIFDRFAADDVKEARQALTENMYGDASLMGADGAWIQNGNGRNKEADQRLVDDFMESFGLSTQYYNHLDRFIGGFESGVEGVESSAVGAYGTLRKLGENISAEDELNLYATDPTQMATKEEIAAKEAEREAEAQYKATHRSTIGGIVVPTQQEISDLKARANKEAFDNIPLMPGTAADELQKNADAWTRTADAEQKKADNINAQLKNLVGTGEVDIAEITRLKNEAKEHEKNAKDARDLASQFGGSRASLSYILRNGSSDEVTHVIDQISWELGDKANEELRKATQNAKPIEKMLVHMTKTGVEMGFDAAVGAATGVGGLPVMFTRVFGQASQQANRAGASLPKQLLYGATVAGIEVLTEKIADLGGGLIYGKGFSGDFTKRLIHNLELSPVWEKVMYALADTVGEGLEEGASDLLGGLAEIIIRRNPDKGFWEDLKDLTAEQLADVWYDMLLGSAMGLVGAGGGAITGQYNADLAEQYNADIARDQTAYANIGNEFLQRAAETQRNLGPDASLSGAMEIAQQQAKLQSEKDSRATKINDKIENGEALTDEEFNIAVAAGWVDKADRAEYTSDAVEAEDEEAPAATGEGVQSRLGAKDNKTRKVDENGNPLNRMRKLTERMARIAEKLGYGNKTSQSDAYKTATGMTPEEVDAQNNAASAEAMREAGTQPKGGDAAEYNLDNYDQAGINKLWKDHKMTSGQYAEAMVQKGFWSEATARNFLSLVRREGDRLGLNTAEERKRNLGDYTIGQNNAQNAPQEQSVSEGSPALAETAEEVKPDVKLAEQNVTDQQESGIIAEQKGAVNNGETGAQETVQRVQPTEVQADNSRGERKTSSFEPGRTGENGFVDARYTSRAPVFTGDRAKELSTAWQEAAEYTEKLGGRVLGPDEVDKKASPEMLAAKDAIEKNFGIPVTFYTGISAKTGFVDLGTPDAGIFISCDSAEDFAISLAHELSHVQWRRNGDGISRRSVVAKALIDSRVSKEEAISLMYDILKDYGTDYIDYSGTQEEWDAMSDADRVKELTNYAFKDEAIEDIYEEVCNYLFTKDALFTSEYESFKDVADKLTDALVKNGIFTQPELDALNKISRDFEDNSGKLAAAQVTNDGGSSVTYGDRKRRSHLSAAWQHNPNNLPGVEPRTETERSAYTRAYINATNGMQPGESKIVVVRTGSNAYLVEADGAIPGLILHKGAANDPLIQKYTEEIRNAISGGGQTTGQGNVSTWSNGRRNIDDDVNSRNKGTEKANASMAAQQPGSYESGDASEIDRDFWDRPQDEVEADIDSGVMPMSDNHVSKYGNRVVKESSPQGSGVMDNQSDSAALRKQSMRGEEKAVRDSGGTTYVSKTNAERSRIADHQLRDENWENEINRLLNKDERWDDQDVVTAERAMYKMIRAIRDYQLGNSRKMKKSGFDALIKRYNDLTTRHINEKSKAGQELQATYQFTPEELVMNRMAKTFLGFAKDGTFAGNTNLAVNAKIYAAAEDAANRITKAAEAKDAKALAQICKDISDIRGVKNMFGVASGFASKVENEILNAIAQQENGVEALQTLALGNLNAICDDVQPYKVVNAAKTIRVMNMLSNMSTIINNITNNIASGLTSTNAVSQGASLLASKAFENITGQTVLAPAAKGWVANKEIRNAEMEALKMATLVQLYGVNQENGKLEIQGDRGLFNPNANAFEQTMAMYKFFIGMGVEATDEVKSAGLMKAMNVGIDKALAKGKITEKQAEAMRKEAEHEVRRLLYKDDNRLSGFVQGVRNKLNKVKSWGNDDIGTIGLGDISMAFAKIPANVVRARLYATPEGCLVQLAQYTKGVMKAKRMHSEVMARQIMEDHAPELKRLRAELQDAYDLEAKEVSRETKDAKIAEIKSKITALNRECWNEAREKCSGGVYNKLIKMRDNYGSNLDFDDCVQRCKYSDATEMSQFEAATYSRKIGKAATSAGMVALGAILRGLGALRDFDQEPDDELRKMYKQKGYSGLMFNWSAIGRPDHEWRDGDIILDADFLEVVAMPLAIGACAKECAMNVEGKGKTKAFVTEAAASGLSKTFEAVGDIPGMADAINLYNAITSQFNTDNAAKGNRVFNAGVQYLANTLPSFFIPNAYTQLGAGLDNTVRDTYTTDNIWQQAGNIMLNKTAFLRKKIPASVDMWGEERTYGENKFWGVINKTLLPGDRIKYRQNKYESEIIRLTKEGYKGATPKLSVSGSFEVDGETYEMDADEKRAYRQNRNTEQAEVYQQFMDSPEYAMLSDDQKVAVLKDLKMDCERDAKQTMLNDRGLDVEVTRAKWETELQTTKEQITYLSMKQLAGAAWDSEENRVSDYAAMDSFLKDHYGDMTKEMRDILDGSMSQLDKMYDARKVGIDSEMWQKAYDIYKQYNSDEGEAAVDGGFKDWEATEMWTKMEKATGANSSQMNWFEENMGLMRHMRVDPEHYQDLTDKLGWSREASSDLTKAMSELQPSNGNKTVSYKQRLRCIAESKGTTDDQKWEAFYEYCPSSYTKIIKGMTNLRNRGYTYEQALKSYKSGKNLMWWVYENEK